MRWSFAILGLAPTVLGSLTGVPVLAADFYAGKTLTLIVGSDVGGGFDTYARAVSRHIARHIPGNPTIVVQNMPGAGSNKAAEYIFAVAPKDGTVIGAIFPGAIMSPLLDDRAKPRFEPTKFVYLGTADSTTRVCATYETSRVKTFEDAQKTKTIVGASAMGGSSSDYPFMLNELAGTRFSVVSGYKGTSDITLAVERGEVDGLCGFDWSSIKSQKSDWLKNKKLNMLLQVALEPDPELTKMGVPEIWNYISGENRKVAELIISQQVFGRPYMAPPGTPEDRAAILREAFMATMKDKDFLADAENVKIDINPKSGAEVQRVIENVYAAPKELVERAKKAIKPSG